MKRLGKALLLIITTFLIFGIAYADQTVTFQWDANSPAPDGYRLYQRIQTGVYDYSTPVWEGTAATATLTLPNGDYAFVVRAYTGSSQSGDSNEVQFSVEDNPAPVIIPGRPKTFTVIFQ